MNIELDNCGFTAAAAGLGDFTFGSAYGSYVAPDVAGAVAGFSYNYLAMNPNDQGEWEKGIALYSGASNLARSNVGETSALDGISKINFSVPPRVTVSTAVNISLEGTFTPILRFGGGTSGITYSLQSGTYIKTGKLVHISIKLTLTNNGSSGGNATITGLPFTSHSVAEQALVFFVNDWVSTTSGDYPIAVIAANSTSITLLVGNLNGIGAVMTDGYITNNSGLTITGTYIAA